MIFLKTVYTVDQRDCFSVMTALSPASSQHIHHRRRVILSQVHPRTLLTESMTHTIRLLSTPRTLSHHGLINLRSSFITVSL